MIPRLLVPKDARPPVGADAATQRRRPTTLDERTLVPAMLPIVNLNGNSSIPTNLPLESIAARIVVPRDVSRDAYGVQEDFSTPLQPTDMDARIAVPVGAAPPSVIEPLSVAPPPDLVEPDIFITGEVNLTIPERKKERIEARKQVSLVLLSSYALLITLILLYPKIFPPRDPTAEEMDLARRQMTVLLPPGVFDRLKAAPRPVTPPPTVHVDPRVLRNVAPPVLPAPTPAPQPEKPRELPSAPVPKINAVQQAPPTQTADAPAPKAPLKLDTPDMPRPHQGLILPKQASPSESIENSLRGSRPSGPRAIVGGGQVGGGGRGVGGGGKAFGGIEMLTPDQGVDFDTYLQRVYYTVKRNWFAVMPTSVELGEKGIVVLTFRIMRDGSVPSAEPIIQQNSGKEPLDRAAYSSVRASNPFETLPPQFTGPYIELRYTYLYNIPIEQYYRGQ